MKDGYYRIKTWDRMAREYGVSALGHIKTFPYFVKEMEPQMPKDRIVCVKNMRIPDTREGFERSPWDISTDMIDEYLGETRPEPRYSGSDFCNLGNAIHELSENIILEVGNLLKPVLDKVMAAQKQNEELERESTSRKPGKMWVPENGDSYFYLSDICTTEKGIWSAGCNSEKYNLNKNNIFSCVYDSERHFRIQSKLYRIAGEVDYGDSKTLFYIYYDKRVARVYSMWTKHELIPGVIYSNDIYFCSKAIREIGMPDLIWFYSLAWRF